MDPAKLDDYLNRIQVPETTSAKIRSTLNFYRTRSLLEPKAIFVGQAKDADGNIRATSLWLFDGDHCAEADVTNGKISGDVASIGGRVRRAEMHASDEEFEEPDTARYLRVNALIMGGLICELEAFGVNRAVLWDVFEKYFRPQLIRNSVTK